MRLRFFPHILAALVCSLAATAYSQAGYSADEDGASIRVGAGANYMNRSFDDGSSLGDVLWIDIAPPVPALLQGLGVEIEGEQIGTAKPTMTSQQREQIAAGGLTYSVGYFRRFQPHVKILEGYGNAEYVPHGQRFNQTRNVTIAGAGITYPLGSVLSARVDYEYQWWPNFWVKPPTFTTGAPLTPSGFSIGLTYRIAPFHRRY